MAGKGFGPAAARPKDPAVWGYRGGKLDPLTPEQTEHIEGRLSVVLAEHWTALCDLCWRRYRTDGRGCLFLKLDESSPDFLSVEYIKRRDLATHAIDYSNVVLMLQRYRPDIEAAIVVRDRWQESGQERYIHSCRRLILQRAA